MNIWQAIILGFVQGVTEFLPVSSSGHLVIFQKWLEIYSSPLTFDLFLHIVSIVVVIYYFRKSIKNIERSTVINLIIATIPLLIIGFIIRNSVNSIFESTLIAGFGLLMTGLFNFLAAKYFKSKDLSTTITSKDSFIIGLCQVIAIIPGISRSGSTLFGASLQKIDKAKAFEFSFLMAVLAILASSIGNIILLNNSDLLSPSFHWTIFLTGGLVCFFTSLASLNLLKLTLKKTKYHWFGWYCIILGVFTILLS